MSCVKQRRDSFMSIDRGRADTGFLDVVHNCFIQLEIGSKPRQALDPFSFHIERYRMCSYSVSLSKGRMGWDIFFWVLYIVNHSCNYMSIMPHIELDI